MSEPDASPLFAGQRRRGAATQCPGCCFIIPSAVLRKYAHDPRFDAATRKALQDTQVETERLRGLREAHRVATMGDPQRFAADRLPHVPEQQLFNANHRQNLPGKLVHTPTGLYKTAFDTTAQVVEFYKSVLGRNSVDDKGFDLSSTLHYGRKYDNAFWNGQQMVYGDGDGELFTAMVLSPDVIGHELTHGVTQNASGLRYAGESGALNESISDVFGAVFNQWLNQGQISEPDGWLIGAGIMAAPARAKGLTCLRDMAEPGAAHCLSPQPDRYSQIDPSADVHDNSGVPNKAFVLFARAAGGPAWTSAIQVWYDTCTDRHLRSDATFAEFATLTVASAAKFGGAELARMCSDAWLGVEVEASAA